jgi:hypothetical protein
MAALTAASWTVVVTNRKLNANSRERVTEGTLALAGTDTYPTGGVPLPDKGKFGMVRELANLDLFGQAAATTQYLTKYDKTNYKMQFYEEEAAAAGGPLLEADTAEVPGARTYFFVATGW